MYRFFRESGIISVFLVIILVPCIAVSSMFVDISRVMLGKGAATSAADLALNSLMSNYDALLTELYGLVGSCQTIDQFYSESTELFVEALQSRELSTEDIDSLLGYTMSVFNNDEIKDLLALEVTGDTSKIITPVKDANLGNAVIIEDQIVEFMKYRGPIEITKGIIDRLQKGNVASALGDVNENQDLTDAKEDFADAADDLSRQLYYLYKKINAYEKKAPSRDDLKNMSTNLTKYKGLYREINYNFVAHLHKSDHLTQFTRYTISNKSLNENYINQYKKGSSYFENERNNLYSTKVDNGDGTYTYYIDQEDMQRLIKDLKTEKDEFISAKNAVIDAVGTELIEADVGTGANQTNPIQWWKTVRTKIGDPYAIFKQKAKDMVTAYAKLLAAGECEIEESYKNSIWMTQDKKAYDEIIGNVKSDYGNYLASAKNNPSDKYHKLVGKYESVSKDYSYLKNSSTLELSNKKTIGATVGEISSSLTEYRNQLTKTIRIINQIIDGDEDGDYKGLDNLSTYVTAYNTELTDWNSVASGKPSSNQMAQSDKTEIQNHKAKYGDITEQSVTQLKNRFSNIKSQLQDVVDAIDGMKYGGEELRNITNYNDAYENIENKIGTVPLKNSEISSKAETLFKDNFTPYSTNKDAAVVTLANIENKNYSPVLTENEPSLYTFVKEEFSDMTVSEEDAEKATEEADNKEKESDSKDKQNNAGEGRTSGVSTDNINDESSADTFPSGFTGAAYGFSDSLTGLISVVKNLVTGNATTIRDDIYLTEYCMDMFSYATYVNEGKRALYQKQNSGAEILYSTRESTYMTAEITGNKDTEGTWLSEAKWDTYNQSLTNRMINDANNLAFGAEVEYVLFGKGNEDSVKKAYSNIFAFRYILNLASCMQHFWGNSVVNGTATGLSGLTGGIVPAILIKVIMLALITIAETTHDLDILQAGLSVPIYKAKDDWAYSFPGGSSWSLSDTIDHDAGVKKFGLYYSDYMYLFLLMGFQGDTKSAMCKRIGDVIQVNMRIASAKKDYSLKKSIVYFNLTASVKVKPLMLDLSYAEDYANNPKNDETLFTIKVNETRGYS